MTASTTPPPRPESFIGPLFDIEARRQLDIIEAITAAPASATTPRGATGWRDRDILCED